MREPYIVEFVRVGNQVKVTACDPATGIEAVVQVPSNMTRKDMMEVAAKKLDYVLAKKT